MSASLNVLGKPALERSDRSLIAFPEKAFVLAVHLALDCSERWTSREAAARFLWESAPTARRSGNLRQLIQRIQAAQTANGVRVFAFVGDRVQLVLDEIELDLSAFVGRLGEATPEAAYALGRLYRGELLAGVDDPGPELAQWILGRREGLRGDFVRAVAPVLDAVPPRLSDEQTVFLAHRLAEVDGFEEAGHRGLIRLHARRGDLDAAQRVFRQLSAQLSRDLGTRPSEATRTTMAAATRSATVAEDANTALSEPEGPATPVPLYRPVLPVLCLWVRHAASLSDGEIERARAVVDDCIEQLWRTRALTLLRIDAAVEAAAGGMPDRCDYRLDCTAGRAEGRIVLRFQLLSTGTSEILWSSRLVPEADDGAIARTVEVVCRHIEDQERAATAEPGDARAVHRQTLQGGLHLRQIDLPSVRRAKTLFRSALATRADHAAALAGMSKAFRLEWLLLTRGEMSGLETAEVFAKKAMAADPDNAQGAREMGICQIYRRRYELGLTLLERAVGMMPADGTICEDLADARVMSGLLPEGLAGFEVLLARDAQPNDQLLWYAAGGRYLAGRYADAIALLDQMLLPDTAFHLRAASHAMLGELAEAAYFMQQMRERIPDFNIASRSHMAPLRRIQDREHFEAGLKAAGFDR